MRVLVVEDDKQLAAALRRGLEEEGYAVDTALDGVEGEWLATENSYDALVLDIMLPQLRGDELCVRRREAGDWTPILMLTARSGAGAGGAGPRRRAPTTSWPSRSRSWCCSPGCARWSDVARGSGRPSSRSATCGWTRPHIA